MKPYFEEDGIVIYHADWRDCLDLFPRPAAVVTDQPFGTGWVRGGGAVGVFEARYERAPWDTFSLDWIDAIQPQAWVSFAPNSQAKTMRKQATAEVRWRKTNPRPNGPDTEPIFLWPMRLPSGMEWVGYNGDTELHPCQKPLELMLWLLEFCDPHLPIVDPFMGSGTTLHAAKELNREAVGSDIDEANCEIAARRLSQKVLQFS